MPPYSKLRRLPVREVLQILEVVAVILFFDTLARLAFYLLNADSFQATGRQILLSVKTGLRFDLATLAYASAPGLPALALGAGLSRLRLMRALALWTLFLPHALTLFLNLADIVYFRHTFRRQTNELFTMTGEALTAAGAGALQYWWLALLTAVLLIALYASLRLIIRPGPRCVKPAQRTSAVAVWGGRALLTLGLLVGGAFLARGGTQDRPLRTGMAFTSDNPTLGQLALNSAYSIIWTRLHQNGHIVNYMPVDSARMITQELIRNRQDRFPDQRFPLLRTSESPSASIDGRPWNVVILIMESWNARQTGAITGNRPYAGVTPVFDSLARDGLLFTDFYASGDRSIHAFPAIVASLPNLTGSGVLHTSLETKRIRGLGSILRERGYTTIFAMGAEPSSMGFDSYARACGFELQYSEDSYPDSIRERDENRWGVFDERYLRFIEGRLARTPEPFAMTFFSLTAHAPFVVPRAFAERHPIADDTDVDGAASDEVESQRQKRALRYADYALGRFFESARKREYFKRTIFIITGDHTGWEEHTPEYTARQRFQVPLLIYAPALVPPGRDTLPANQVDILPTVLSLLGGRALSASLGQSLVEPHSHRISLSAKAEVVDFLYDSLFVQATSELVLGVYNYRADPESASNLMADSSKSELVSELVSEAIRAYHAYRQTGLNSLIDDRIFPPAPLLQEILQETANGD